MTDALPTGSTIGFRGDFRQVEQERAKFSVILLVLVCFEAAQKEFDRQSRGEVATSLDHPTTSFRGESLPDFFQEREEAHIAQQQESGRGMPFVIRPRST